MAQSSKDKLNLADVAYVKAVTVGSINPNNPVSDRGLASQVEQLNRCLNTYPKGIIIGKDTSIGRYRLGDHELTMERTTYHIGFPRKPVEDAI